MKKVSIILPVYNSEKQIRKCLDALINQTYSNFEVLCVNDGSCDNSLNILNEYSQKDSRIKVFSQTNSGPATARNTGLNNATGDYLMFCDSDDWYEPDMIETMVKSVEKGDVDFAMCDANVIVCDKPKNKRYRAFGYHTNMIKKCGVVKLDLYKKSNIKVLLWNKIFKMDSIKKYNLSFPDGYECDDTAFVYQYMFIAKKYYAVNKALYNYCIWDNSIMDVFFSKTAPEKMYDKLITLEFLLKFLKRNKNLITLKNKQLFLLFLTLRFKQSFLDNCKEIKEKQKAKDIILNMVKKTKNDIKYPKFYANFENLSIQDIEMYLMSNSDEKIVFGDSKFYLAKILIIQFVKKIISFIKCLYLLKEMA